MWVVSVAKATISTVVDRNDILSFLHYNTTVASDSPTFVCSGVNLCKEEDDEINALAKAFRTNSSKLLKQLKKTII